MHRTVSVDWANTCDVTLRNVRKKTRTNACFAILLIGPFRASGPPKKKGGQRADPSGTAKRRTDTSYRDHPKWGDLDVECICVR